MHPCLSPPPPPLHVCGMGGMPLAFTLEHFPVVKFLGHHTFVIALKKICCLKHLWDQDQWFRENVLKFYNATEVGGTPTPLDLGQDFGQDWGYTSPPSTGRTWDRTLDRTRGYPLPW